MGITGTAESEGEIGVGREIEMDELDVWDVAGDGGHSNDCCDIDDGVGADVDVGVEEGAEKVLAGEVSVRESWASPSRNAGHSCPIN